MIHEVTDPAGMRRLYVRNELTETAIASNWLDQLRGWFDEAVAAAEIVEANAVQLATVDADGRPSVRTVLVKALDERGIVFYTGYDSAKGRDLAANPNASAVFAWLPLERQVRLSGPVERVDAAETAAYFASRPRGSQLGAWASPQSQPVASRAELAESMTSVTERFAGMDVPVPPDWGGYLLRPQSVEFWQGRPDRLHDRLRYRRVDADSGPGSGAESGSGWVVERLAP